MFKWYWPILKGFINFLLILLLGKDFIFDIAVYLQAAIMLLWKFVYTFSLFFFFFLNVDFSAFLHKEDLNYMFKEKQFLVPVSDAACFQ